MRLISSFLVFLLCASAKIAGAAGDDGNGNASRHDAAGLRAQYAALSSQLRNNQFQRPLMLQSSESSGKLQGDIYAVLDHPFATVNGAFNGPAHWCDMLILHLNTKYCKAQSDSKSAGIKMVVGKKTAQSLDDAYPVDLNYQLMRADQHYLGVKLNADEGPMGTRDFQIALEAIPIENNKTFIHFTYAYSYGMAGGLAMKAYLASKGSNKVGFTITGHAADASPQYVQGVRGMVERNTMRYYLAIDSYLASLSTPQDKQVAKRLQNWFTATEQYPRQLREISRKAYLSMKEEEIKRSLSVN